MDLCLLAFLGVEQKQGIGFYQQFQSNVHGNTTGKEA